MRKGAPDPRRFRGWASGSGSGQYSVAAYVALMGQQRPKNVGWAGGIDGGQDAANREIRAKYAQNYGQDCGAAD
jgi:hypothetical protein